MWFKPLKEIFNCSNLDKLDLVDHFSKLSYYDTFEYSICNPSPFSTSNLHSRLENSVEFLCFYFGFKKAFQNFLRISESSFFSMNINITSEDLNLFEKYFNVDYVFFDLELIDLLYSCRLKTNTLPLISLISVNKFLRQNYDNKACEEFVDKFAEPFLKLALQLDDTETIYSVFYLLVIYY